MENFIKLVFVVAVIKYFGEAFLRPPASCSGATAPLGPLSYATGSIMLTTR